MGHGYTTIRSLPPVPYGRRYEQHSCVCVAGYNRHYVEGHFDSDLTQTRRLSCSTGRREARAYSLLTRGRSTLYSHRWYSREARGRRSYD